MKQTTAKGSVPNERETMFKNLTTDSPSETRKA